MIFGWIQKRFQRWWQSKLPLTDTLTLTQRNVYILPTRPGFMLALTLLVLLVASINYQLNLGYLLTFMLAGATVVGMHVCHGTLRGLTMHLIAPHAHFAGATATVDIQLVHDARKTRHSIGMSLLDAKHWAWTDVPPQGSATVQVAFKPAQRGLHRVPTLTAETRFPLGTFRVWTVWRPKSEVLIYPAPELHPPPLPPGEPRAGGGAHTQAHSTGEFDGVRGYRRGDPMKLVVWKQVAKAVARGSDELVSRDTQQTQRYELWLDLAQCGHADKEHKLSRLCAWVLQADKLGVDYGLRLPARQVKPASGEAHKRQCLEALALC
jgi:uncharacterized protein (DUF58 family)